jgi:hypothetical protein
MEPAFSVDLNNIARMVRFSISCVCYALQNLVASFNGVKSF